MNKSTKFSTLATLFFGLVAACSMMVNAQQGPGPGGNGPGGNGPGGSRDGLSGLKRAIAAASAPTLTTQQETDLKALITAYRDAQPDDADATLSTARDAFDAAILAGNLTAAQTAATQIATRQAELGAARLKLLAKFEIDVLANLQAGGQLTALKEKLGDDKLINLVGSLAGQGGPGGPGGGH